jgi:tetratricopeptide (TPR) repeat protein
MFLWVKLMVDMLASQTTFQEVESSLANLPAGLDKAYASALQHLSYEHAARRQVASKILMWATCAARPLKVAEIATVFSIKEGWHTLDSSAQLLAPRQLLLRICGSFLEVLSDDTVQFTHMSAKDFLLSSALVGSLHSDVADFVIDPDSANREVAETCLAFLSLDEFRDGYPEEKAALKTYCEAHPLLDYASRYWTYHIKCCREPDPRLLQQVVKFISSDHGYAWVNGPAYVLTPTMSYLLVLQAQLSDWAALFSEETPGRSILFDVIGRMYETFYERSTAVNGPNHESTTRAMISLALFSYEQGKLREAESPFNKAIDVRTAEYGSGHDKTLDCISNQGLVYYQMGRLKEAEAMFKRALDGWTANWGPDSYNAYWAHNNLGNALYQLGKLDDAEVIYKRSIEGQTKLLGRDHADTQRPYGNLGLV